MWTPSSSSSSPRCGPCPSPLASSPTCHWPKQAKGDRSSSRTARPLPSEFVDGAVFCTTLFVPTRFLGVGGEAAVDFGGNDFGGVAPAGVASGVAEAACGPIPIGIGTSGSCDAYIA